MVTLAQPKTDAVAHVCPPGVRECNANGSRACAADGSAWGPTEPCDDGEVCAGGHCVVRDCVPESVRCVGRTLLTCRGEGAGWEEACDVQTVLVPDGAGAGLPHSAGGGWVELENPAGCPPRVQGVSSCVVVDLDQETEVSELEVRIASVEEACGTRCVGADCGTGRAYALLASLDAVTYGVVDVVRDFSPDGVAAHELPSTVRARYVAAYRSTHGAERNHVAVDYLAVRVDGPEVVDEDGDGVCDR